MLIYIETMCHNLCYKQNCNYDKPKNGMMKLNLSFVSFFVFSHLVHVKWKLKEEREKILTVMMRQKREPIGVVGEHTQL